MLERKNSLKILASLLFRETEVCPMVWAAPAPSHFHGGRENQRTQKSLQEKEMKYDVEEEMGHGNKRVSSKAKNSQ